jgi:hypothetical protein
MFDLDGSNCGYSAEQRKAPMRTSDVSNTVVLLKT